MAMTEESKEFIKDALENGINGEAIESAINNLADNEKNVPQIKQAVESISNMKQVSSEYDETFLSEFFRKNSNRIELAIKEGLTPEEIAMSLENDLKEDTYDSKKYLKFKATLLAKIKEKELRLTQENSYQKSLH